MRNGKIAESVLMRSVLRKIKTRREETVDGAGIGRDCAILSFGDRYESVLATASTAAPIEELGRYAVHSALNNVAASGAEPVAVMLNILLPEGTEESALQRLMEQSEEVCHELNVEIVGGHTEVTPTVKEPVMTATGIGKRKTDTRESLHGIRPNQDIVVSKWIGLEGTVRLAKKYQERLRSRYPMRMIETAAGFDRFLSVIPEAATAVKSGVCGMHDVSQGGIFGALWEMASGAGVGLELDLKKLPVKQETIEICEFFELNPYELLSGGCLIMTTGDGIGLTASLAREQIPAVVVGRTTVGNDRVLYRDGERRFLDMPKMDQIKKFKNREDGNARRIIDDC